MSSTHHFELYVMGDRITASQWNKLYRAIVKQGGLFGSFELMFACTDNVVRFFVSSPHSVGALSNGIEGMVLRQTEKPREPTTIKHERFIALPTTNILDMREYYLISKHKTLEYVTVKVGPLGLTKTQLFFRDQNNQWSVAVKYTKHFAAHLFAIDFAANTAYLKKQPPLYLDIEKSLSMLTGDPAGALFSVDTFPYFARSYYLNLAGYEFDKHSLIIGSSGSGKSKLIELLIDRLHSTVAAMNYRIVVIDPHAALEQDLQYLPSTKIVNFSGETAQLFPSATTDISAATELTTTLLKSLMSEHPSPRLERVLRFSLYVLFTGQCMSLSMLKSFLTEIDTRNELLQHVNGYVPDNLLLFFGSEFNEIRTQHYSEAVSPITALIEELQLQPALLGETDSSLAKTIQDNFLTVFSLNKVSMGDKVVKTVAGLLIQQIFLLAQARIFGQKVILVIDEVSVVQNPALASILAEARKFNLTVILSQQYFGQIEKSLRDAILSNVLNYYIFRVSEEDARALEANLTIDIPKEVLLQMAQRGLKEGDVRTKLMTELHPRECLARLTAHGQILPAVRAHTVDTQSRVPFTHVRPSQPKQNLPAQFIKRSNS
jgi:energy-coupling factor transporter ATP-binding protein EcfA2